VKITLISHNVNTNFCPNPKGGHDRL
jgi:hypothetical protein